MIHAGVKEIKNNLSRYLSLVKQGEEIVITHWGKPIARITGEKAPRESVRTALAELTETGAIVMPSRSIDKSRISTVKAPGKPISEMVIEDRR